MRAPAMIQLLEGLVSSGLRLQGTDTANRVAQAALFWLDNVKHSLRDGALRDDDFVLDVITPAGDDAINTTNAGTSDELMAVIARNNAAGPAELRVYQETTAGVAAGDDDQALSITIPGRNAANEPGYRFLNIPGRLVAETGNQLPAHNGWSAIITALINGTTTPADSTIWMVFRNV